MQRWLRRRTRKFAMGKLVSRKKYINYPSLQAARYWQIVMRQFISRRSTITLMSPRHAQVPFPPETSMRLEIRGKGSTALRGDLAVYPHASLRNIDKTVMLHSGLLG